MSFPVLSVVTPPDEVISLADAKAHLRVDTTDDDTYITGLIAAATGDVDGATGWLGRALGEQTLALTASHFPGCGEVIDWRFGCDLPIHHHPDEIRLRCPPILSITGITYFDPTNTAQTLNPASYALADRILYPTGGAAWPAAAWRPDAVRISYVAGYADGTLPAPIRAALLLKISTLYTARNDGQAIASSTSDAMLSRWQVFA